MELIRQLYGDRITFSVHYHDESKSEFKDPVKTVKHNALSKALSAAKSLSGGIVIGADTVVVCKKRILGKPETNENAIKMLNLISGHHVEVMTGIAVVDIGTGKKRVDVENTMVKIKKMNDKEIRDYVMTGEPLDKAGAFGIQGKGAVFIEGIIGDYFNVVGLPLFKLAKALKKFGVSPF